LGKDSIIKGDNMFYGEKDEVRTALDIMQKKVCCYVGEFCDCKYGFTGKAEYGEQTCCPELRTVVELLDKMTEEEYINILSR